MLRTLAYLFLFAIRHRDEINQFLAKHGEAIRCAIADAQPIVQAYVEECQPGSETVETVVQAARKAVIDSASPMPGEEWSPTNPNPNAG